MKNVHEMMLLKLQKEDQILKLQQEVLMIDRDLMNAEIQEELDAIAAERQLKAAMAQEILADMNAPEEDKSAQEAEIMAELDEIMKVIMKNKCISTPFGEIPCGSFDAKDLSSILGSLSGKGESSKILDALKSGKAVLVRVG